MPDLRDVLWFLGTGEAESFRDDRILESGTRAAASVLSWRQFGRTGRGTTQPNIRMRLRVEPRVEAAYDVKWSGAVSETFVPLLDGTVLDVAIDPKKPTRVAIDWGLASTPVVFDTPDGQRLDLARNLAAKREVLEVAQGHAAGAGEVDFRQMPEARSEVQEVLRRHGFPVPP